MPKHKVYGRPLAYGATLTQAMLYPQSHLSNFQRREALKLAAKLTKKKKRQQILSKELLIFKILASFLRILSFSQLKRQKMRVFHNTDYEIPSLHTISWSVLKNAQIHTGGCAN